VRQDTSLFTELSVLAGEGHFETDAIANFEAVLKSADRAQHALKAREKALGKVIAKNRKHLAELKESEHHSAKKKALKVKAKLHAAVKERTRVREKIGRKLSAKIVTRHLQKAAIKNKLAKVKDAHVKKALKAKLKSTRRHIAHENRDRDEIYWKNTESAEKRIDKLHQKVRDLKVATAMEQAAASRVVLKSALRTAQTDLHDAHAQLDKLQLGRQREQEMLLKVRLATTKKADKKKALQSSLKHVQGKIKRIEGDREKRFRSFEALLSKRARNVKSKLSMSQRSLSDAKTHGNKKAAAFYQVPDCLFSMRV
jgi:chromosome segregation ATPase